MVIKNTCIWLFDLFILNFCPQYLWFENFQNSYSLHIRRRFYPWYSYIEHVPLQFIKRRLFDEVSEWSLKARANFHITTYSKQVLKRLRNFRPSRAKTRDRKMTERNVNLSYVANTDNHLQLSSISSVFRPEISCHVYLRISNLKFRCLKCWSYKNIEIPTLVTSWLVGSVNFKFMEDEVFLTYLWT